VDGQDGSASADVSMKNESDTSAWVMPSASWASSIRVSTRRSAVT